MVEGAAGTGRSLVQWLLAQGEMVLDVPAKLADRVRAFNTGNGRKTDAHAIAMVALRTRGDPCPLALLFVLSVIEHRVEVDTRMSGRR